jgi:hypothetical protein
MMHRHGRSPRQAAAKLCPSTADSSASLLLCSINCDCGRCCRHGLVVAGLSVQPAVQSVSVVDPCLAPEHTCASTRVCSIFGLCDASLTALAAPISSPLGGPSRTLTLSAPAIAIAGPGVAFTVDGNGSVPQYACQQASERCLPACRASGQPSRSAAPTLTQARACPSSVVQVQHA